MYMRACPLFGCKTRHVWRQVVLLMVTVHGDSCNGSLLKAPDGMRASDIHSIHAQKMHFPLHL